MKKLYVLDEFFICFISAAAYGTGFILAERFGLNGFLCFVASFVLGLPAEEIAEKIIFSKFIQKKLCRRVIASIAMIAIFVAASIIIGSTFQEDFVEELGWYFIPPLIGFVVSACIRFFKKKKILKKYKNSDDNFIMDKEDTDYIKGLNDKNAKINDTYDPKLSVKLKSGVYVGKKVDDHTEYLGIPYAKAPTGELRWKAPQALDYSDNVYEAFSYGPSVLQGEMGANALKLHRQSEDCLYINVFVGKKTSKKKKVIVYLHGGDFTYGGSANPLYDGGNFVDNNPDTVFVTFNFRFGILGFIDFSDIPGGENYSDTVNLGLLDQICALKWINENIEHFGGNPEDVTLIGDNSGAVCICLLSVIKEANTLFNKAVIISGTPEPTYLDSEISKLYGRALADMFSAKSMEDLVNLSDDDMRRAVLKFNSECFGPVCDGKLVPKNIYRAYENGEAGNISFVIAMVQNEIEVFEAIYEKKHLINYADKVLDCFLAKIKPENADLLKDYIDSRKDENIPEDTLIFNVYNDWIYISSAMLMSKKLADNNGVKVLYWDADTSVKDFAVGTIPFVAAILNNDDVAESYGYLNDKSTKEIISALFKKFFDNERDVSLYNNEIKGVDEIKWESFDKNKRNVLHIIDKKIYMHNDFMKDTDIDIESIIEDL